MINIGFVIMTGTIITDFVGAVGSWVIDLNCSTGGWPFLARFIVLISGSMHWLYSSEKKNEKIKPFDLAMVIIGLFAIGLYVLSSPPINILNFRDLS